MQSDLTEEPIESPGRRRVRPRVLAWAAVALAGAVAVKVLLGLVVPRQPAPPGVTFVNAPSPRAVAAGSSLAEGWPGVPYAEVRAYYYQHERAEPCCAPLRLPELMRKQPPSDGWVTREPRAPLTADQQRRLLAAVTGRHEAYEPFGCFFPHHAFLFLDESRKPVAGVEICFACATSMAAPGDVAEYVDWRALAALVEELGLPVHPPESS